MIRTNQAHTSDMSTIRKTYSFPLREEVIPMEKSKKNELIWADIRRWGMNTIIFTSPALIIFLTALANGVPVKDAMFAMYPVMVNALIDILRKYKSVNTYN